MRISVKIFSTRVLRNIQAVFQLKIGYVFAAEGAVTVFLQARRIKASAVSAITPSKSKPISWTGMGIGGI